MPAYGAPFVHDLDGGRRYGTLADFENLVKLTFESPWLHHSGGTMCEPVDQPVNKRQGGVPHTTRLPSFSSVGLKNEEPSGGRNQHPVRSTGNQNYMADCIGLRGALPSLADERPAPSILGEQHGSAVVEVIDHLTEPVPQPLERQIVQELPPP